MTAASFGPSCPQCGAAVGSTWRWCLACGHDPDGLRPDPGGDVVSEPDAAGTSWLPVVLCIAALFVIGYLVMPRL